MPAWFKRPVSFCPSPSALLRRQNAALINVTFWTFSQKPITALGEISPSLKGLKRCQLSAENKAKRFCMGLITVTSGRLHLLDAQRTPGQGRAASGSTTSTREVPSRLCGEVNTRTSICWELRKISLWYFRVVFLYPVLGPLLSTAVFSPPASLVFGLTTTHWSLGPPPRVRIHNPRR